MLGLPTDDWDDGAPPPSQSHFAKFDDFTPNDAASFDDEFNRLASSQKWAPGSQEYTRQRTQQPLGDIDEDDDAEELSAEEKTLQGCQALCREVGLDPSDSVDECKILLKKTLVNIIDLIDARRTGKRVKVWDSFEAFSAYILHDPEKRIDPREAKEPQGYLALFLQRLAGSRSTKKRKRSSKASGVVSGRVSKRKA